MPEGDTIHKLARTIGAELASATIVELSTRDRGVIPWLAGAQVTGVEALGKHMVIWLQRREVSAPAGSEASGGPAAGKSEASGRPDDDWAVRVHLGMKGRWRRYTPRHAPAGPVPSLAIVTPAAELWCTGAAQVEIVRAAAVRSHPRLVRLGPDVLVEPLDSPEILRRARQPGRAGQAIAELLLDQQVACGIGNIYKSEALFLERVHPFTPAGALSDDQLLALYGRAAELMRRNLGLGPRVTTTPAARRSATWEEPPRFWVYRRRGKPCLRCGAPIQCTHRGESARVTFFCPRCQP